MLFNQFENRNHNSAFHLKYVCSRVGQRLSIKYYSGRFAIIELLCYVFCSFFYRCCSCCFRLKVKLILPFKEYYKC